MTRGIGGLPAAGPVIEQAGLYPQLRYMGSKHRLLGWIHEVTGALAFDSVLDAFSGSGTVSYLFKSMGKRVVSADFLNFCHTLTAATVENARARLTPADVIRLKRRVRGAPTFIADTFAGIFYTPGDLVFLDRISANIESLAEPASRALVRAALIRSCAKRQPRGVFTVADPARYQDGRRDLSLSLEEHFGEQVEAYNAAVFDNGCDNRSLRADALSVEAGEVDLVYLDPPYVPRADDNCYVKRYHFLEGLSCYWRDLPVRTDTKVRKIAKPYTPFSYRSTAIEAFDRLFGRFPGSALVLSYSSNGFPDLDVLVSLMEKHRRRVVVHSREHRYHFGTHGAVKRAQVDEYLVVGVSTGRSATGRSLAAGRRSAAPARGR